MNHSIFSLIIIVCSFIGASCKTDVVYENTTNFTIPDKFTVIKHNPEDDEILAVKHVDDIKIVVKTTISKTIKSGEFFGPGVMKEAHETKFAQLLALANGTNPTKGSHLFIGDHIYLHRSFDYDNEGSEGYFEYGALFIEDPEEYYEFYISGRKSLQNQHKSVIKEFLTGVK